MKNTCEGKTQTQKYQSILETRQNSQSTHSFLVTAVIPLNTPMRMSLSFIISIPPKQLIDAVPNLLKTACLEVYDLKFTDYCLVIAWYNLATSTSGTWISKPILTDSLNLPVRPKVLAYLIRTWIQIPNPKTVPLSESKCVSHLPSSVFLRFFISSSSARVARSSGQESHMWNSRIALVNDEYDELSTLPLGHNLDTICPPRPWCSASSDTWGSIPALLICSYSVATCWNLPRLSWGQTHTHKHAVMQSSSAPKTLNPKSREVAYLEKQLKEDLIVSAVINTLVMYVYIKHHWSAAAAVTISGQVICMSFAWCCHSRSVLGGLGWVCWHGFDLLPWANNYAFVSMLQVGRI